MFIRQAAVVAAMLCAVGAQAQPVPSAGPTRAVAGSTALTLAQAIEEARAISPSREAADAAIRAAEASRLAAGLRANPRAFADIENFIGSGSYSELGGAEVTVGIELPLERGRKRSARTALADAEVTSAVVGHALALAEIRAAVTQLYIDAATAERRLANAREQVEIAHEGLRVAGVRVRAGRASPLEEQRAEVVSINAETDAAAAERLALTTRSNLGRLLGRPVQEPFDVEWFESVGVDGPELGAAGDTTLALAGAEADLAAADARVRLAIAQQTADISLSAGVRGFAETGDLAAVVGVSMPLMIFDNGSAAVTRARAERDRLDSLRRAARLDAEAEIATSRAAFVNAAARARAVNGPVLAAAEEAARIARIGYREGKFGQLDLLEAERTLADTRAAATDALADFHAAAARLTRLTAPLAGQGS